MEYKLLTRASLVKKKNKNPLSHEMQLDKCLPIMGGEKYTHFKETNVSGDYKLENRPVLMELIDSLQKGDILLVYKSDRLFRSVERMIQIKYLVEKKGATMQSATEANIFGEDSFSKLICTIMAAINECNVEVIRSRISNTMQTKIKKGEHLGHIPFGFKKEGKMLVPDEEEQALLDKMEFMLSDGLTYRQIAEEMNTQGYHNRSGGQNRQGAPWHYRAVHRLLKARPVHSSRMEALGRL